MSKENNSSSPFTLLLSLGFEFVTTYNNNNKKKKLPNDASTWKVPFLILRNVLYNITLLILASDL